MAVSNRTHVSIIADILDTAKTYTFEGQKGVTVTHLIRKANVPHSRLSGIVSELTSRGLLHEIPEESVKYRISEKGLEFLKAYNQFKGFAEGFGLRV
ncbi:MAG: transcriptional regulator [Nitrososphaera sp.]|nr:transcriptional regulator [Nitrososphaera sp.]